MSLRDVLDAAGSPVDLVRRVNVPRRGGTIDWPNVPTEYTNWISEQRAWRETCSLYDQSHHMVDVWLAGPDARSLLEDLGLNDFAGFDVGRAKQFVAASPAGYVIGDGILFREAPDTYHLVGLPAAPNWIEYHAETGDYDVDLRRDDASAFREGPPETFRYQIQGPNALDVMADATDGPLPDVPFFRFEEFAIDGRRFNALGHGMSGEAGFEFWGPWADHEAVLDAVLEAGEAHGLRRLGTRSYRSSGVMSGWFGNPVPAVYGDDLADYQRWLGDGSYEANFSVGGSFDPDDIADYYVRPGELGYDRFLTHDRDFVGREAMERAGTGRTKVTLVWNDEDVVDVYASLFREGEPAKFMTVPILTWAAHYDAVFADGEPIGVSTYPVYNVNERSMLSLGVIDATHAEPGTEVAFRWGEARESPHPAVERHAQTEVGATVAPVPLGEDRRK